MERNTERVIFALSETMEANTLWYIGAFSRVRIYKSCWLRRRRGGNLCKNESGSTGVLLRPFKSLRYDSKPCLPFDTNSSLVSIYVRGLAILAHLHSESVRLIARGILRSHMHCAWSRASAWSVVLPMVRPRRKFQRSPLRKD